MARLTEAFFLDDDVARIGRTLLGKHLCTYLPMAPARGARAPGTPVFTSGIIVETEAYAGVTDRASHAHGNRRTRRTETMFQPGGVAYIYLCYGVHALFNIVTGPAEVPHAVLVRAILPTHGIRAMLARRAHSRLHPGLTSGPGRLTQALGLHVGLDGTSLAGDRIWLEDRGAPRPPPAVTCTPRIGVDYAGPDAERPLRFVLNDTPWLSHPAPTVA